MRCVGCGSDRIREVVYGSPTQATLEAARREEIVLGGCTPAGMDRACLDCGHQFADDVSDRPSLSELRAADAGKPPEERRLRGPVWLPTSDPEAAAAKLREFVRRERGDANA